MTTVQVDALREESKSIIEMLMGPRKDKITEAEREAAYTRISQINDQLAAVSSRNDAPVYIVNLTVKEWIVSRSYSSFWIRGKQDGEDYSVFEVTGRKAVIDTGRGGEANVRDRGWRVKLDQLYIPALQVAEDVVREINGDLPPLVATQKSRKAVKTMGVFVSPTRIPSTALLEKHRAELNVYYAALVMEGNLEWAKSKDYRKIGDLHREAADALGISTDWHEDLLHRQICPGCGDQIRVGIAKHATCGYVLDWEKAFAGGMLTAQQVQTYKQRA
jgi:hypothetical protein